jgi:hypothetical protein
MDDRDESVLQHVWSQQGAWSRAAGRARAEVVRYRLASLALVVIASALGAGAPVVDRLNDTAGRMCGLVAGVALGLIPLVRHRLSVPTYERWSRMRFVSESLKAEAYMYLTGVDPYRGGDRDATLMARSTAILEKGDDLVFRVRPVDRRPRAVPAVTDIDSYIVERVERQVREYFRPRGKRMARRVRTMKAIQSVLAVAAVVLGVVASAGQTDVAPWLGVVGTVSGAVIAHSAAGRYGFLQIEYFRTAEQLTRLVRRYRHAPSPSPELDDWLVQECERIIAVQNEAWTAELVTTPGDTTIDATIPPPV